MNGIVRAMLLLLIFGGLVVFLAMKNYESKTQLPPENTFISTTPESILNHQQNDDLQIREEIKTGSPILETEQSELNARRILALSVGMSWFIDHGTCLELSWWRRGWVRAAARIP